MYSIFDLLSVTAYHLLTYYQAILHFLIWNRIHYILESCWKLHRELESGTIKAGEMPS